MTVRAQTCWRLVCSSSVLVRKDDIVASPKNAAGTRSTVRETAPETGTVEYSGALTSLLQVAEGDPSRADLADARLDDEQLLAVLPLRTQTAT